MADPIGWLVDTRPFVTRANCGWGWDDWLVWTHQAGDLLFAASYAAIPLSLVWLDRRKRGLIPKRWMLGCFAAFIFLCGVTHLFNLLSFWWVPYRLSGLVKALGAAVSVGTAALLPGVARHLAALPTDEEYRRRLAERDGAAAAAVAARAALEAEVARRGRQNERLAAELAALREVVRHLEWRSDVQAEVKELVEHCHNIRSCLQ